MAARIFWIFLIWPGLSALGAPGPIGPARPIPIPVLTNLTALLARTPLTRDVVETLGYHTAGDGGGMRWVWVSEDDSGTNFANVAPSDPGEVGRWRGDWKGDARAAGAVLDGVSDDTEALQAALMVAGERGITIGFEGTAAVRGSLVVSNVAWRGGRLLCLQTNNSALITITGRGRIEDLEIDGNDKATVAFDVSGSDAVFKNVRIENLWGTLSQAAYGIRLRGSASNSVVHGGLFRSINGETNGIGGDAIGAPRAIYVQAPGCKIIGVTFEAIGEINGSEDADSVQFQGEADATDGWTSLRGLVANSTFNEFGKRAIKIQASDVVVKGNTILSTYADGGFEPLRAIDVFGSRCVVEGNTIDVDRLRASIHVNVAARETVVRGNTIWHNWDTGHTNSLGSTLNALLILGRDATVIGNTVYQGNHRGLIGIGTENLTVVGNVFYCRGTTGAEFQGATNTVFVGNEIYGVATNHSNLADAIKIVEGTGSAPTDGLRIERNAITWADAGIAATGTVTNGLVRQNTYSDVATPRDFGGVDDSDNINDYESVVTKVVILAGTVPALQSRSAGVAVPNLLAGEVVSVLHSNTIPHGLSFLPHFASAGVLTVRYFNHTTNAIDFGTNIVWVVRGHQ
jgi:hypothetical protein